MQMNTRNLTDRLIAGQNDDGGWGYYRGKKSRLEPTCWAALSLANGAGDQHALRVALQEWPSRGGLLLEHAGGEPNYAFHGLALIALHAAGIEHRDGNIVLAGALQRMKGVAFPPSDINRQDNSIQGWSWIDGTFSWVEPTAWCLFALKTCALRGPFRVDPERERDAERLLVDRSCAGGGWNYGNSNMLGKELVPYVPTTAVALLAMRDRGSEPIVSQGLSFLDRHATFERSAMALGLASRALAAYGRDTEPVRSALSEQLSITVALGNHAAMAAALYALSSNDYSII